MTIFGNMLLAPDKIVAEKQIKFIGSFLREGWLNFYKQDSWL